MKSLILLSMILVSCGVEEKKEPEPEKIEVTNVTASPGESSVQMTYATSHDDLFMSKIWTVVAVVKEGDSAPASCRAEGLDVVSEQNKLGMFVFNDLQPDTVYSVRICAHKSNADYYSAGNIKKFKTMAIPDDMKPYDPYAPENNP